MFSFPKSSPLGRYHEEFTDIPGFFMFEAMVLWDFFFLAQQRMGIRGDFLEIGVYRGRSAVLGALYLQSEERAVFVDLNLPAETRKLLQQAKPGNNVFLERRSCDLLSEREIRESPGTFRWCHIDGDHTGYSTARDLQTSASLVSERGIICVDDFFSNRYPQLTAAVYTFLSDNSLTFRLLFCGANKCYICRASSYAMYEREIRDNLYAHLRTYEIHDQIFKTSFSNDGGCFSMGIRGDDRAIYGMDENPDFIPF